MHKHFLLTVSDDRSALYGARFVNAFFENKDEVKFTLLYIAPRTGQQETMEDPPDPWPFYFHIQKVLQDDEPPVTPIAESVKTMDFIFQAYEATGDSIVQCRWPDHQQVPDVLDACCREMALPGELSSPPAWA